MITLRHLEARELDRIAEIDRSGGTLVGFAIYRPQLAEGTANLLALRSRGFEPTDRPNRELFELEPNDIQRILEL